MGGMDLNVIPSNSQPCSSLKLNPPTVIEHMNAEQADANLMDVKVYGHLWRATTARVVALDQEGVDLEVTLPDEDRRVRLTFEHRL